MSFLANLDNVAAKWYIELPRGAFQYFNTLEMAFLTHFQLSIRYETSTHLLTSLKLTTAKYISDHVHEWRRWRHLIKFEIP